jgi:hypothetical protein
MKRVFHALKLLAVLTALIICAALIILYAFGEVGRPVLYLLPGGYTGWVGIRFADSRCPPLRYEGWYLTINVNKNGRACTSTDPPAGWRYYRFEHVYADGKRKTLGGINDDVWLVGTSGPESPQIALIFIGTREQKERAFTEQHDIRREIQKNEH